jgi:hypothetical protein
MAFGKKAMTPMPVNSINYRQYSANYYSGADIRIYFGDTWVDEVTNIDFTLQEQVAPIFGYASFTWDKVARGSRYISGSFSINFKETAYLQMIMNSLRSDIETDSATGYFSKADWDKNLTIEQLVTQNKQDFHALANDLESSFWGEGNQVNRTQKQEKTTYFYPNYRAEAIAGLDQSKLADNGFNIVIAYGGDYMSGRAVDSHETVQTIMGVQLTGISQQIGQNGQPIQETYQFIAKDLQGDARYSG